MGLWILKYCGDKILRQTGAVRMRAHKMLLSAKELVKLTEFKQPSKQIAWLRRYGIRVFVSRTGHPRVLRSDLESKGSESRTKPDLDALRQLR